MKAVYLSGPRQPLVIREIPDPRPGDGEVLIEIHYAAVNHRDLWMQLGQYGGRKEDLVLGSDGCGVVKELGSGVDKLWLGKEVVIHAAHNWGNNKKAQGKEFTILGNPEQGTFAELITVKEEYVFEKPTHLDLCGASAFPLAGVTAYRALFTRSQLQPGQKVLIRGIGAGTALFALQFAVAFGCKVYVTSGQDYKIEKAIQLGAQAGVNYKNENWHTELSSMAGNFDVIVDSAAGPEFTKLIELCAPGGTIVNFGGTTGPVNNVIMQKVYWKQLNILGTTMGTTEDFSEMLKFINNNHLQPVIDAEFPMDEAEHAFRRMENGEQFGKIILKIRND